MMSVHMPASQNLGPERQRRACCAWLVVFVIGVSGCSGKSAMAELGEARALTARIGIAFATASNASSRAVMSDTDESSVAYAREAEERKQDVQKSVAALQPLLQDLRYADEVRSLEGFAQAFAEYRAIDDRILELAVENSNIKAQRLSFGPVQETSDAIRAAVDALSSGTGSAPDWHLRALGLSVLASVREIQALQAPHIDERDDDRMTGIEAQMAAADASARGDLRTLATLVPRRARPGVAAATSAFERFMELNAQVVVLSRRNTNVRSLAMSLNEKGKASAGCEERLRSLSESLSRRMVGGTR